MSIRITLCGWDLCQLLVICRAQARNEAPTLEIEGINIIIAQPKLPFKCFRVNNSQDQTHNVFGSYISPYGQAVLVNISQEHIVGSSSNLAQIKEEQLDMRSKVQVTAASCGQHLYRCKKAQIKATYNWTWPFGFDQ